MSHSRMFSQSAALLLRATRGGGSPGRLVTKRPLAAATAKHQQQQQASQYHQTARSRMAYKDDQDRESLKPKNQEYSKSDADGDDAAAHIDDAAFNPEETSPEKEKDAAGKGGGGNNPLESSPANQELSAGTEHKGNASGQSKQKSSGGSSSRR